MVKHARLPAGLDRPASGCATPSTWPGSSPTCCPTTPPGARSRRCRWPGASRGTPAQADAAARQLDAARRRAGRARRDDRPRDPGRLRAGARLRRRDHRAGRRALLAGVDPELARRLPRPGPPGRAPGRSRPRRCARLRAAGLPVVKVQVSAALEAADPAPTPRRCAAFVEPRFLHQTREPSAGAASHRRPATRRWTARCRRRAVAGALPRAAARRARAAADLDHRRCCAPRWRRWSAARRRAATTSRSRPTPGACCPPAQRPTTTPAARRGHRRRAGLRPRRPASASACRTSERR